MTKKKPGVPPASSLAARNRMKAGKPRDTSPEIALRKALNDLDVPFTIDKPIDGVRRKIDIYLENEKVAIFVDGCFWHGCPIHGTWPKANADFWKNKIESNKERDIHTNHLLKKQGISVLRVWEHENPTEAAEHILRLVREKSKGKR